METTMENTIDAMMSPLDTILMSPSENHAAVVGIGVGSSNSGGGGGGSGGGSGGTTTTTTTIINDGPSHDEILIQYLILNPCLWDKSNAGFRNRSLKDSKWKEVASKIRMSAHEAVRRYKTLCERFRRETVKQQQIPGYTSSWGLFEKFASLKDAQMSECKSRGNSKSSHKIKMEPRSVDLDVDGVDCAMAMANCSTTGIPGDTFGEMDFLNDTAAHSPDEYPCDNNMTTACDNSNDGGSSSRLFVEPTCIGGSTDLSTDTIAAFCQFLEANLKQFSEEQSDELIEDISLLLFRKRKEFKQNDKRSNNSNSISS